MAKNKIFVYIKNKLSYKDQKDNTVGSAFALHAINPDLSPTQHKAQLPQEKSLNTVMSKP